MPLSWLRSAGRQASVSELIARRKYSRALEALRAQFAAGSRDPHMRLQLADVLVMAGRSREAVPILQGLADELAAEGFAAKAIALLKKIEKIEPGRPDVERRLAGLIEDRSRSEAGPLPPRSLPEIGIEEVGAPPDLPPEPPGSPGGAPGVSEEAIEVEVSGEEEEPRDAVRDAVAEAPAAEPPTGPSLFSSLRRDELVALMHGLRLVSFAPGDIVMTEGEPGDSLFVLTTGVARVFVRNAAGRHVFVREVPEGSFFGEVSILTGGPRTATVTAGSDCDLLELDRPHLDEICARHPNVARVIEELCRQRAGSELEAQARATP